MPNNAVTARGRSLGADLRQLRKKLRLTTREAAKLIGWSPAMLNRTENGLRVPTGEEVAMLLGAYGVTGTERDRLLKLTRDAEKPGWWEAGDSMYPAPLKALIGFEAEAVRITDVELVLIPGLLQTSDYARAVMQAAGAPTMEIETRLATRLGRQHILRRPNPPQFLALIDEAALRRPVGGRKVMAAQLRHLQNAASRSHVTIQVIPFRAGAHATLSGTFTILEFERARSLVYQEGKRSLGFVDAPAEVASFVSCVDTLKRTALPPSRSVELIESIAVAYER